MKESVINRTLPYVKRFGFKLGRVDLSDCIIKQTKDYFFELEHCGKNYQLYIWLDNSALSDKYKTSSIRYNFKNVNEVVEFLSAGNFPK